MNGESYIIRLFTIACVIIFLCGEFIVADNAPEDGKKIPYTISKIRGRIKIDGDLNDPAWQNALKLELKYEVFPGENIAAPVKTELFLTYNNTYLYVGFNCRDNEPGKIRAHFSDRDNDYGDDFVGIALDTFNDERKNFMLWCNPRGVQEDAIMNNFSEDYSWDARYKTAAKISEKGWYVEMAIPFSSIRFQRTGEAQTWGIDAWRLYPRNAEHLTALFPHDRNSNCYQCQMIKIRGFKGIKPGRNLEIISTLTAVRTDARSSMPDGKMEKFNQKVEPGLTARLGITPNLTLSGTINPDFSQVEADAWKLDINQPFALFYEEKRPFFIEGSHYFSTGLNAVYSRTLRNPAWGLKLTGKEAGNSVGAYIVRDDTTNLLLPGSQDSQAVTLTSESVAAVLRYKRDLGSKYTVGALFTSRSALNDGETGTGDYFNRVYGVDGSFRLTNRDRVDVDLLGSSTRYDPAVSSQYAQKSGTFSDHAFKLAYTHKTRSLGITGDYTDIGADFRADLGFVPQVGYRRYNASAFYRYLAKPGKWWFWFQLGVRAFHMKEQESGELLRKAVQASLTYEGKLESLLALTVTRERQAYGIAEFDLAYVELSGWFRPVSQLFVSLDGAVGDNIDYDNIRDGKRFGITPGITWLIGDHINVTLNHTYERMTAANDRLYTANITQSTIIYQFNTRMFFRSIFQYVYYNYNSSNYLFTIEPTFKHLFTQLLFSYKLNPQTVFFLGYSDNYQGNRRCHLTRSDRTFFLKLSYAWQL